ncbi:MAG: formylglycine-generating enzyme family protein [Cyanobacteria bacterium P01_A01_bin.37]
MRDLLLEFIQCLHVAEEDLAADVGLSPGVEEIADMLWLAEHLPKPTFEVIDEEENNETAAPDSSELLPEVKGDISGISVSAEAALSLPPLVRSVGTLTTKPTLPPQPPEASVEVRPVAKPVLIPAAAALRHPLQLVRSLRPLIRKTASRIHYEIDEEATAIALAKNNPIGVIQRPAQERWLELEIVVEESKAALIWDAIAKEFVELLGQLGAFRTLRVWRLDTLTDEDGNPMPRLICGRNSSSRPATTTRLGRPKELINAAGQRLVILLSDCISPLWRQGLIHEWLAEWGHHGPAVILHWFPEPYWSRTALKSGSKVWLSTLSPGISNDQMERHYGTINPDNLSQLKQTSTVSKAIAIPVVTLEPSSIRSWARVVAGYGNAQVQGRRFKLNWQGQRWQGPVKAARPLPDSGEERFLLFSETASAIAKQLAGLMSLGPVSPEITHLIQEKLLPQSGAVHVAEVFLSGLLEQTEDDGYRFVSGVKEQLQKTILKVDEKLVFHVLSEYISERHNRTTREFRAFLQRHREWTDGQWNEAFETSGFAELRQRLKDEDIQGHQAFTPEESDENSALNSLVEEDSATDAIEDNNLWTETLEDIPDDINPQAFPPFKTLEFEQATVLVPREGSDTVEFQTQQVEVITIELDKTVAETKEIQKFGFSVSAFDARGNLKHWQGEAWKWDEDLGEEINLEMVYVPSGEFWMGTSYSVIGESCERPPHRVMVPEFYMGRYPITQIQWRMIASLSPISREIDPDPSSFKGDNRPVEQVNWYDAVEFCERLSRETRRAYRLPTEAEWEYACRAETSTAYHFGIIINKKLANYKAGSTVPVNQLNIANAFGLSEMHGNIQEWCQDYWHDSYTGAPTDGSAWLTPDKSEMRILRGGSWINNQKNCRSASRNKLNPHRHNNSGFRVVCGVS